MRATEADDDTAPPGPVPGLRLSSSNVTVPEGKTATYTVALATRPDTDVTVKLTRDPGGDPDLGVDTDPGTPGAQSTLVFTPARWNIAQTVTVAAAPDEDSLDGTATFTHTATGGGYGGVSATLTAVEADDNRRIVLSASSLTVPEGGAATYTVALAAQPIGDVRVTLVRSPGGDADLAVDTDPDAPGFQSTLVFTPAHWNDARTVAVAAAPDDDGFDGAATFTHTASGGGYGGVSATLAAAEADDDRRLVLSPSRLTVPEGMTATYTVALASEPVGDVTVTLVRSPGGDADLAADADPDAPGAQRTLTFTPADWSDARPVTVAAAVDADGLDGTATFTHTATGSGYGGASATLAAVEADADRGLVLSPSRLTVPEGSAATYTVALASQPVGEVTVTLTRDAGGDADLAVDTDPDAPGAQRTLTFTPADWSDARTVTVAAAVDADGLDGTAMFTHTATGSGYGGASATLAAVEADADRALTLSRTRLAVPEGMTATYTVALAAQPVGEVAVTITRDAGGDADLAVDTDPAAPGAQRTLVFTPSDWSDARTVTVAAAVDADGLDGTATFTHTATGSGYGGASATLAAVEADADRGLVLSPSRLTVPEGMTATYTVALASRPSGEVTVTLVRDADGDADLAVDTDPDAPGFQSTLVFTPSDWSDARPVTVAAAVDADGLDGTATFTHTATGSGYDGVSATLAAVEADDDRGLVLSPSRLTVPEGSTATYTVALAAQPVGEVTVTITRDPGGDADLAVDTDPDAPGAQATLAFTPADWRTARAVTVAAAVDADGIDGAATFTHTASGGGYDGVSATLAAVEADDDRGLVLSPSRLTVPEGSTVTYTVALAVQPSDDVTVTITGDPGGDADLAVDIDPDAPGAQATLAFTPADWRTARAVTVAAAVDADGIDGAATFTHTASGGGYDGVSATLAAVEADDDRGLVLSPSRLTVPEGATVTYTVALAVQPSGDVTVTITGDPGGDADLAVDIDPDAPGAQSMLTFTPADWSTARTVTVAAAVDADGLDGAATFTHTATGGDYAGVSATLAATEADDDRALTLSTTRLTVPEGATATYSVKLASPPSGNVAVRVARSSGDTDLTVDTDPDTPGSQGTLTFTPADWRTAQTVTVAAAPDADGLDGTATFTHTASGGVWTGVTAALEATEKDEPAPVAVGTLPALTLVAGGEPRTVDVAGAFRGTIASYTVRSSHEASVAASVQDARVTLTPLRQGEAQITVTARNRTGEARQPFTATVVADPADKTAVKDGLAAIGRGMLAGIDMALGARLRGQSSEGVRVAGYALESGGIETAAGAARGFSPDAGRAYPRREREDEIADLDWLDGTSFVVALNAGAGEGADLASRWTLWGQGDLQSFGANRSSVDGETRTAWLGLDTGHGDDWLLGAAVSYGEGHADYAFEGGGGSGRLRTTLTSVHPYLRWRPWEDGTVWAALGLGHGRVENRRHSPVRVERGDLSMFTAWGSGRYDLALAAGGADLALLGDLALLRMRTDTGSRPGSLDDVSSSVGRLRFGLEGSWEVRMESGELSPFAQVSARHDSGDGETGSGMEVSGGVRYRSGRVSFETGARVLWAGGGDYEESGWNVALALDPREGGRGLSLSPVAHLGRGAASRAGGVVASGRALGPGRRSGAGRRRPRDADKHRLRVAVAGVGGAAHALCRARPLLVRRAAHQHGGAPGASLVPPGGGPPGRVR